MGVPNSSICIDKPNLKLYDKLRKPFFGYSKIYTFLGLNICSTKTQNLHK